MYSAVIWRRQYSPGMTKVISGPAMGSLLFSVMFHKDELIMVIFAFIAVTCFVVAA
jgi:hypothetical protein